MCIVNEDVSDDNLVDAIVSGRHVNRSDMAEEKEAATVLSAILAQENKNNSTSSTQIAGEDISNDVCESLIYI